MAHYGRPGGFTPFQYGYTLGPGNEANNGDYAVYNQYAAAHAAAAGGVGQSPNNITIQPTGQQQQPMSAAAGWAQMKVKADPSANFKAKVFVTASSSTPSVTSISTAGGQATANTLTTDNSETALLRLHELALQNRLVEKFDPTADPAGGFVVKLTLGNESYSGRGNTIKAAKQNAAMQALVTTKYKALSTMKARPDGVTATSQLHELATKKGVEVDFRFLEPFNFNFHKAMRMWKKDEMRGNYTVNLTVAGHEFIGKADLPQMAKHHAAEQAMPVLQQLPDASNVAAIHTANKLAEIRAEGSSGGEKGEGDAGGSKNPIMRINEIAMTHGLCVEWEMVSEQGPPHRKTFSWALKLGEHESVGTAASKKIAKALAATQLMESLPAELKVMTKKNKSKSKAVKRAAALAFTATKQANPATATVATAGAGASVIGPATPGQKGPAPHNKKKTAADLAGTEVYKVIQNSSPISALHEYSKKCSLPEPDFDCISENVLETWQKDNKTFKKTEYTMRLVCAGKTYFGSANTKKLAKTRVATEAWNIIRAGTF